MQYWHMATKTAKKPAKRGVGRPYAQQERDVVFTCLYANPNTPRTELIKLTGRSRRWVQRVVAEWKDQGPEEHEAALERMRSMTRYVAELQVRKLVVAALAAMARDPEPGEEYKLTDVVQKWTHLLGLDAPQRVVVAEVEQPWERILAAVTGNGEAVGGSAETCEPGVEDTGEAIVVDARQDDGEADDG